MVALAGRALPLTESALEPFEEFGAGAAAWWSSIRRVT